ncbi:hypothetical protein [Kitasatospora sp. NPDC097643]|uniref:hypothetical protein n=1 Tax=Kitasatospora sp. NPDC097643 TaxID=3157230 RepID=UPI00331957B0
MTAAVHIPEYLDDGEELLAGEDLAGDPAFWLAHLLMTLGSGDEDVASYGVDPDAHEAMLGRLSDAGQPWLVLRVPFTGGHTACVAYVAYEDESLVDFFVRHPRWGRLGYLGQFGPHGSGPGLSWSELLTLARGGREGADGLSDPAQRLLLLLPALGDADTPPEASDLVARALVEVGIRPEAAPGLAAALLDEPARHLEPHWRVTDDSPLAVCSSEYSPRQIPLALGITAEHARALADALGFTPAQGAAG